MTRGRIITVIIAVASVLLLVAIVRSCRSGSRPPAERGVLEETQYRTDASRLPPAALPLDL